MANDSQPAPSGPGKPQGIAGQSDALAGLKVFKVKPRTLRTINTCADGLGAKCMNPLDAP